MTHRTAQDRHRQDPEFVLREWARQEEEAGDAGR